MKAWTVLLTLFVVCCASNVPPLFPESVAFGAAEPERAPPSVPRSSWEG